MSYHVVCLCVRPLADLTAPPWKQQRPACVCSERAGQEVCIWMLYDDVAYVQSQILAIRHVQAKKQKQKMSLSEALERQKKEKEARSPAARRGAELVGLFRRRRARRKRPNWRLRRSSGRAPHPPQRRDMAGGPFLTSLHFTLLVLSMKPDRCLLHS